MTHHENSAHFLWQEHQTNLLIEELGSILRVLSDDDTLYNLLKEPLSVKRRGLAPQAAYDVPWHLLPLIVCESICCDFKRALPIAAAFQLMLAAGDVFDDVEDADSPSSLSAKYGFAIAINTATTLMILAERAISKLQERGIENRITILSYNAFNSYYSTACRGQHLDLSAPQSGPIPEDRYLKILSMKSASQIECACHISALIATTDDSIIEAYGTFGRNLGMAAQIANDILGITDGKDIVKRKITLPVLYALTNSNYETRTEVERIYISNPEDTPSTDQIKDLLINAGSVYYTTLKQELYKQKALDALSRIADAGINIDRIKLFLK